MVYSLEFCEPMPKRRGVSLFLLVSSSSVNEIEFGGVTFSFAEVSFSSD